EEIRGTFRPTDTNVPGVRISEHLPRMARLADRYAVLRSVRHAAGNHPPASYWMMVGSPIQRATPQAVTMSREDRPHPGSALALPPAARPVPAPFRRGPRGLRPGRPRPPRPARGLPGRPLRPLPRHHRPDPAGVFPGRPRPLPRRVPPPPGRPPRAAAADRPA